MEGTEDGGLYSLSESIEDNESRRGVGRYAAHSEKLLGSSTLSAEAAELPFLFSVCRAGLCMFEARPLSAAECVPYPYIYMCMCTYIYTFG